MTWLACTFSQLMKRLLKSAVKIALSIWPAFFESEARQRIWRPSPEIETTFNSVEPWRRLESRFVYGFLYIHLKVNFYSFQYFSMVIMMVMMLNCFCGTVYRRKAFSLISSRDHCQRFSPSRISDTPRTGFEPAQNVSSGFVEWICAVVITTTLRRYAGMC